MLLYEWGIDGDMKDRPGLHVVGVTGSAPGAQARMLTALEDVPRGVRARGWVTQLALGADRLTYDRLATLERVSRDVHGKVRWTAIGRRSRELVVACALAADPERQAIRLIVVDGRRLAGLRQARGLSQEQVAWDAGVSVSTLARLEGQDRPRCRSRTLALLAQVLGENPHALVSSGPADRS
ncbi:MAG: helix-turn-helix domain-containing protein [Streptosporangiaceae bacterium]